MKLLAVFLILISTSSFGQADSYQNLLDTALKARGSLFLHSKPLMIKRLDHHDMWQYSENIRDYSSQLLDTTMFYQIIQNARVADTTLWMDHELPNFILVKERGEDVSKEYLIQKFRLTDKRKIKKFRKYVNKYNSTEISDRNICYYSRPVLDNSKTFAIVEWDNGHGYVGGGGGIILFQLQSDNTWKEFGIILNWRY